jgi:cholesterol transport system auxiliary component
LETDIVRLQHQFDTQPSHVRFTLLATFLDNRSRRVLAWREFDRTVVSATEDPHGGVVAAHQAVNMVMDELVLFGMEVAAQWPPPSSTAPQRPRQ